MTNFQPLVGKTVTVRTTESPYDLSGEIHDSELGADWIKLLPIPGLISEQDKKSATVMKKALHLRCSDIHQVNELEIVKKNEQATEEHPKSKHRAGSATDQPEPGQIGYPVDIER